MRQIKTETQIERDFFTLISASTLGNALRGTVYRSDMRPDDANSEDLVIKFLTGLDDQVQEGVVILNLYVPDILHDGRMVADRTRIGELQELILQFIEEPGDTEYLTKSDGSPTSISNDDIHQHIIIARIRFQRLTD